MNWRPAFPLIAALALLICAPSAMKANKEDKAQQQIKLGMESLQKNDFEGAIAAFQSAAKLQKKPAQARPYLSLAYYSYGSALKTKGELDRAVEMFRRALDLDPDEAYWHAGLAGVLETNGDRQGALQEFQIASKLSPDDWGLAWKCRQLQGKDENNDNSDSQTEKPAQSPYGLKISPKDGATPDVTAPKELISPSPAYTEQARQARYSGFDVLSIVIDKVGRPTQITVVRPLGMGLDQSAIKAVSAWQFEPGKRNGVPVPVRVLLQVTFRLY